MITAILVTSIIFLILSLTVNIFLLILVKRLLSSIEIYKNWIIETRNNVSNSLTIMRDIDKQWVFSSRELDKGIFESDDMVGQIFKQLTEVLENLNQKIQE